MGLGRRCDEEDTSGASESRQEQPQLFLAVERSSGHNASQMSTANAVGVALSSAYGIMMAVLAIAHVRGRPYVMAAVIGAGVLGIYWSVGRQLLM